MTCARSLISSRIDASGAGNQRIHLVKQCLGANDDPGGNHRNDGRVQDPGGKQREFVFLSTDDNGMAGVVPAEITHHDVVFFGEQVDDFALGFVSPLKPDDRSC